MTVEVLKTAISLFADQVLPKKPEKKPFYISKLRQLVAECNAGARPWPEEPLQRFNDDGEYQEGQAPDEVGEEDADEGEE